MLVYGELCGAFPAKERPHESDDEDAAIHKRLDVFTEAWVGIAPAAVRLASLDVPAEPIGLDALCVVTPEPRTAVLQP